MTKYADFILTRDNFSVVDSLLKHRIRQQDILFNQFSNIH